MSWEYLQVISSESGQVVSENGITTERTGKMYMFPTYANYLGNNGWEMVSAAINHDRRITICFFKRQVIKVQKA